MKRSDHAISLSPASAVDWFLGVVLFFIGLGLALYYGWSKLELFWGYGSPRRA